MPDVDLVSLLSADIADELAQVRAVPVGIDGGEALLFVHSAHPNVDPYANYFTFPEDTLTLTLVSREGEVRWTKDLGPGIVPGIWFCPVVPFDLDGDGVEEIWYVDTEDPEHPLSLHGHRLARLDPESGTTTGLWEWPDYPRETLSHTYRNFVLGGHADGEPVLVTAQGTYGELRLQGWDADLRRRWETQVAADDPGARGSHMCPVLDLDGDGVDEVLWGERCLELDTGTEVFCADREAWDDHSDIVQPTLDREDDTWYVYTCREGRTDLAPRVVTYDDRGERVWSAVDEGHMHVGWTARLAPGDRVAMAGRDKESAWADLDEFAWDAFDGTPRDLGVPVYSTWPVDIDGDGCHELVYRSFDREGRVIDGDGTTLGRVSGSVATFMPSKLLDRPGEHVVTFTDDGTVRVWGDRNAADGELARWRYDHPYYEKARRLGAVGYNWRNLGGL